MQVTEHVHALKIPFPGTNRFVYLYLIIGEKICLIDSGILAGRERLVAYLRDCGRDPKEIALIVLTHSHPDHIGLSGEIKGISNCTVAIHPAEKAWVEDIELQISMRPTLTFRAFVQQPVAVDRTLRGRGDAGVGGGSRPAGPPHPRPFQRPRRALLPRDGALFTGDGVPAGGTDLRGPARQHPVDRQAQGRAGGPGSLLVVARAARRRAGRRPDEPKFWPICRRFTGWFAGSEGIPIPRSRRTCRPGPRGARSADEPAEPERDHDDERT
ncbi:MAG: MBL fold metallo-hydrolase [Desulfobacterales bacterium]|nr:MBL fold metallo-hydrolase [Desulfobacterales bacterium]